MLQRALESSSSDHSLEAKEGSTIMPGKTLNPGLYIGMFIMFNTIIISVVRPFNLLGVVVMNSAAIGCSILFLRILQTKIHIENDIDR